MTFNVILFLYFENEQRFLGNINCIWALFMNKSDVSILKVALYNDLTMGLVGWNIISPVIKKNLNSPITPTEKMQSIYLVEHRKRSVGVFSEEECGLGEYRTILSYPALQTRERQLLPVSINCF